jgi:hypothetical protein
MSALRGRSPGAIILRLAMPGALLACRAAPEPRNADAPALQPVVAASAASAVDEASSAPAFTIEPLAPGLFALHASRALRVAVRAKLTGPATSESAIVYRLIDACPRAASVGDASTDDSPSCRELAAGEVFVPVAWSGQRCSTQCAPPCARDTVEAGLYQLQVHACDDASALFQSAPFQLPDSAQEVARLQVAALASEGSIARLHEKDVRDPSDVDPTRLAGRRRASETRALSAATSSALANWLRASDGFDDENLRRCVPGTTVGVSLRGALPGGGAFLSELSLDFGCNALWLLIEHGGVRSLTASYFETSRTQILSIVRAALPDDAQLSQLR